MSKKVRVLPLEEAIKLEAKQNMERDVRVCGDRITEDEKIIYEEEAREVLSRYGVGYDPEYADHFLVKVG